MEPKEESIKMLEMRMRRQLNFSPEKNIKPENIQYYVSSAMLQKEETQRDIHLNEEGEIAQNAYRMQIDGWKLSGIEEVLEQDDEESFGTVRSIEKEKEDYWQKLQNCRTKEEVQRVEEEYRQLERLGLSLTENNTVLSVERKLEHTLFKDTKISAIRDMTRQFIESEEYEKLPTDAEYIQRFGGMPQMMGHMEISGTREAIETKEVQHARAKSGYEQVRRSMGAGEPFGSKNPYFLNAKG